MDYFIGGLTGFFIAWILRGLLAVRRETALKKQERSDAELVGQIWRERGFKAIPFLAQG